MQPILFVDLDGVLVDLRSGLSKAVGQDLKNFDKEQFDQTFYKFIKGLSYDQIYNFWTNLPFLGKSEDLWEKLQKHQPLILSAAGNCIATCQGKKNWCKKHLKLDPERVFCSKKGSEKQFYASPKSILIDDQPRNIKQFKEKGGHAIMHTHPQKTLRELKKIIKKIGFN